MLKQDNKNNKQKNPFSLMEEEVLDFWEKNKIFEQTLLRPGSGGQGVKKDAPQGDYVFYDGPPFITGLPHYATLLPSIAKDVVPRYWTMKGYRVERVWGWDCHGLPAENKVEEQLELRNKKDIEKLGVDKFINACREYVSEGSEQWEWYINRIARWVDMKNAYRTMDLEFMESVIWAFKELYKKDLIYEGYRSSLHCPRCATPLSKFEITMDAGSYKDVSDETVVVKFKLETSPQPSPSKGEEETYLLAWTTTPWTLPGNLALAVGEDIDYVKLRIKNEIFILAKERVEDILKNKEYEILGEFKGKDLIGLKYESIFDLGNKTIQENKNVFKVYAGNFINTEDGTGIVHIAPNFGEDDFNLGQKENLPLVDLMDENGIYTSEAGEWQGQYFKKANKKVLEDLGDKLFSQFSHTHSYPFCYRCSTPLIFRAQKAWYLRIADIRAKMIETNKNINWVPEFFKEGRFQYNLENAPDWCLSRSRYWGSPIPVWKCQACTEIKVIGSLTELEELSGKKISDLHKPGIDEITFKCKCGGEMKRVSEVMDCWFESGAMPFAQFHYPFSSSQNKNLTKSEKPNFPFPADFIIEYTGQLRGWFYYLHVLGNALFNKEAFKNVIVTGVLAGNDGRKMSKSYGNYPDPKDTLEKYGGDALRMYFMNSPIMTGGDMNFNEKDLQEALRKNVMLLWNIYKFYEMFADSNAETKIFGSLPETKNVLDKWILARLNQLIEVVTENLEKYNLPQASRPITDFIDDFSTWYIRRSRDRFKGEDEADKKIALETTRYVLLEISKVIAPFIPFIAEQVWQKVSGNDFKNKDKSVHLESWSEAKKVDEKIIEEMEQVRKIVELGLAKRDKVGIRVRQPLGELQITNYELLVEYENLILEELNVKKITCKKGDGELSVELDTQITLELKQEGIKREFVRFINNMRKDTGLTINDLIIIYYQTESQIIKTSVESYKDDLIKDTLAKEIKIGETKIKKDVKIEGESIILGIKKI